MNNIQILTIIAAAAAGFALAAGVFIPLLKKKGVKAEQIIDTAQAGLETADKIADGVQAMLPDVPGVALVGNIIDWARKGVDAAEQLYKAGTVTKEQRKEQAVQLVVNCLTAANIEVTPDVQKVIEGCVEAEVFALPQTHTSENKERYTQDAAQSGAQAVQDTPAA